jgi:dipeptidyl aminopeptidase/acylaminoacyl peptidase
MKLAPRLAYPILAFAALLLVAEPTAAQEGQTLTWTDLMKVRQIQDPTISADGRWVALSAVPDRGDGEVLIQAVDGSALWSVPRGDGPRLTPDGAWAAVAILPAFGEAEASRGDDGPKPGLALLRTATGEIMEWEAVRSFAFSADGRWLARLHHAPEVDSAPEGAAGPESGQGQVEGERTREDPGTLLIVRDLASGMEHEFEAVRTFVFPESGQWLAMAVASRDGQQDGVHAIDLSDATPRVLSTAPFSNVGSLTWAQDGTLLAWVLSPEDEAGELGKGVVQLWDGRTVRDLVGPEALVGDRMVPGDTDLQWSEDGQRLFFGTRVGGAEEGGPGAVDGTETNEESVDPYDLDAILEGREVDVWHTFDPLINPNQKQTWRRSQSRTDLAMVDLASGRVVQLGDAQLDVSVPARSDRFALAESGTPYLRERTWVGTMEDRYVVSLRDGERRLFAEAFRGGTSAASQWVGVFAPAISQSPEGRFVAWFQDDHWHLFDAETGESRNLTQALEVPFYDPDHDYPEPRGGHGVGGWLEGDEAVLIHDKYDVWQFPTDGGEPLNLTGGQGREARLILRVLRIDPDAGPYAPGDRIHLASFGEDDKAFGFWSAQASRVGLDPLLVAPKRFRVVAKADQADVVLFTREDYDEFPDLWVSGPDFRNPTRVTDVNPGLLERFAWGTSELVEWTSDDGTPLQGVVIKPGNYEPGRRYPVLTYFYRFFSQRLHEFNQPVINHRPSFPMYASDGYIVFLPDVRFEVGRPGMSSLKSVVPGVKKLVDMGLADPDALGLHGHSWSGYTTSYIVTQTNIFAAAVAGAPVSNMTSAYGGIRWGTGLARQFQYEQSQSRLSGSLWESRQEYVENSPLFYADRVETPLVIMHGDEDEAVPWYQSIEFYLGLRRNGKQAVFLQYRGEPHHPRKYANKLDYSIRMKAFFDHHLKGGPAPVWWTDGVPYSGK